MTRWRVAARLARREVRRHWARSLLVVAIIALPVAGAQAVGLAWRSAQATIDDDGWYGSPWSAAQAGADERIGFDPRLGEPDPPADAVETAVGFQVDDWTPTPGRGTGPDDLSPIVIVAHVPDRSSVAVDEGRAPRTRHEVLVADDLAGRAGVGVGDTLEAVAGEVELTVVGLAGAGDDDRRTAWVGPAADEADDWVPAALARIRDSGSDLAGAEMYQLVWYSPAGEDPAADAGVDREVLVRTDRGLGLSDVVVGAVVAAIAIGFVATTASSAFAIGARRQMRQLGILAAAGASPADLLRAVVLQGTVLGLAGGVAAAAVVYAGRAVLRWVWLDDAGWVVARAPGLVVAAALLGVVAGTAAAIVPALTASRVPVLSALAGRRPTRRRPLRSPGVGLALVPAGLLLLTWASGDASQDSGAKALAAVCGVFATLVGVICLSPGVVALAGDLSGRVGGTVRLAGRSLARSGMRTAAVVSSTAVAFSIPAMVLVTEAHAGAPGPEMPVDAAEEAFVDATEDRSALIEITGPDAETTPVAAQAVELFGDQAISALSVRVGLDRLVGDGLAVDPERLRAVTGDDEVADALAAGALVRGPFAPELADVGYPDGPGPRVAVDDVAVVEADGLAPITARLLTSTSVGLVADVGIDASTGGLGRPVVVVGRLLTDADRTRVRALATGATPVASRAALAALAPSPYSASSVDVSYDEPSSGGPVPIALITLAGSALLALLVVGTSSALTAADGRDDERVIAAVGAPPAVARRRRVLEAGLIATSAMVLGGGVGVVGTLLVIHHPTQPDLDVGAPALSVPVLDLAGMAVGGVVVIAGVTWLCLAAAALLRGRRDLLLTD